MDFRRFAWILQKQKDEKRAAGLEPELLELGADRALAEPMPAALFRLLPARNSQFKPKTIKNFLL